MPARAPVRTSDASNCAASRNTASSQAAIAPGPAMVRPREDTTCARQILEPKSRASAKEWRSAFSEGWEKSVAINTERGSRSAAICDIGELKAALAVQKTVGEVRAT